MSRCSRAAIVSVALATILMGGRTVAETISFGLGQAVDEAARAAARGLDFTGEWAPRFYEDQPERVPGPDLGDYLGIPISPAARLRGQTWNAAIMTLPEWQCRPHSADYIWRGPSPLHIWKEVDPVSREIVTFHAEWLRSVDRAVYLDGRPRPSEYAPHTWAGFSTATWEGDMLTIKTTHLKEGYLRRNGLPRSDQATLVEHWMRHGGDILTVATIVTDPVYLTEPFIRTTDYELDLHQQNPPYPCEVVEEVDRPKGVVPHHLPGTNPYLTEFATKHGIPVEATRGGAETMYPDYQATMTGAGGASKMNPDNGASSSASLTSAPPPPAPQPAPPPRSARASAPADLTGSWVSVVTEDWRWRMVTPTKGDYASVPLNDEGRRVADRWDPAKDQAAGEQCRAYGAAGIMRVPGRAHITWQDENTLRIDTEAGTQTRVFGFAQSPAAGTEATWQGQSVAQWESAGGRGMGRREPARGGTLKVVTTRLRPGYLRKNGVPYGANAVVTEYYNRTVEDSGDSWLIVTTVVDDPQYLNQRFITSTHFKKLPEASPWHPTACRSS